ncbi:hypothetical protein [Thalassoglobus sp.]|uniref:hypothetical protein n=1 Tax=Thalassoglobus sp. TaxID=2795869 RepID=UPI003AA7C8ED
MPHSMRTHYFRSSVLVFAYALNLFAYSHGVTHAATERQKLHVKQARLYDANGFQQPLLSRTFLIPADWQVAGGVQWNSGTDPNQPAFYESFSALSSDGRVSFEMLPAYSWVWVLDPNVRQFMIQTGQDSQLAPPLDATGVVQHYIIPNYRPGATIVQIQSRPDLANAYRQQLVKSGLQNIEASGLRISLDFVEAKLSYMLNGERYFESVSVQLSRVDTPSGLQLHTASNLFLFRAPAVEWESQQFVYATALRSMRQNPAWLKAIGQFNQNVARIRQEGAVRRQQIMSQMYEQMRYSQQQSWEYRQESVDYVAREFNESIREVETYSDPATGFDVELPNSYDYAFSNGLGEYIVTNDPSYNPTAELSGNWHPLQAAR